MENIFAMIAKTNNHVYRDIHDRPVELTVEEREYFKKTVADVLRVLGFDIPVYMCDHENLPGKEREGLGIHWKSADGSDEFITIDNYFIHECYQVAFCDAYDLNGETIATVLCHELAHITYRRHTKYHAELTEAYIDRLKGSGIA